MPFKSNLFKIKYRLYRGNAFTLLKDLKKSQFWSEDQWQAYRNKQQKLLVKLAFEHTRFYAKFYSAAGFQAGDIEQECFFEKLPILTKTHLRESFEDIVNPDLRGNLGVSTTGGSTGVPVKCGYNKSLPIEAYGWRSLEWWGLNSWDDGAYVWRNPRANRLSAQFINQMLWWPTRKIRFDASAMTPQSMDLFIREWNKFKPPQLQGYVGAVVELAQYIENNRISVNSPKVVWVTSAPLLATQRLLVERVFNAPVYDQYGCCELPWIAAQCEKKQGLHVNDERVFMEFVDEANFSAQKGNWGRTLLTRLDDYSFPLIRYEVGDTGRYLESTCSCGRTLSLIDQVKGRITDIIRLPSGRVLSGEYLTTIFDDYPDAVSAFRVTQKRDGALHIEYVPVREKSLDSIIANVKAVIQKKVDGEVPVSLMEVQSIPHDRGKLRFVVREV